MDPLLTGLAGLSGAPVVVALVSATVKPFVADSRWYGLAALGYGILWNVLLVVGVFEAGGARPLWISAIVGGCLTGLAAGGFYAATASEVRQSAGLPGVHDSEAVARRRDRAAGRAPAVRAPGGLAGHEQPPRVPPRVPAVERDDLDAADAIGQGG